MIDLNRVIVGDCREVLRTFPDGAFQCCVTSPPYWGLRDYGTGVWQDGDPTCSHERPPLGGDGKTSGLNAKYADDGSFDGKQHPRIQQYAPNRAAPKSRRHHKCGKCGATRIDQQLGLEATPEAYVERMVEVFREVRRVLRDDGTLWLNLGDSYAAAAGGVQGKNGAVVDRTASRLGVRELHFDRSKVAGLKPKDLVGIPWRVAFALQADGWWLRSDIIWAKPNPMPESVTDRCTSSHEYIFHLAKAERYYYDAKAIAEPSVGEAPVSRMKIHSQLKQAALQSLASTTLGTPANRFRNARTVWTIASQPYSGAHFATFPEKLAQRCILAGSRIGTAVLDPFIGSGTVGRVAEDLGRRWLGIELNPDYVTLARKRTAQKGLPWPEQTMEEEDAAQ